jgi:hypothetical protein
MMILSIPYENPWNILQQPVHPSHQIKQQLRILLSALDQGWQVMEPIYLRSRWGDEGPWVYHIILSRTSDGQHHLLTVPVSDETGALIQCEGWRIDASGSSAQRNPELS